MHHWYSISNMAGGGISNMAGGGISNMSGGGISNIGYHWHNKIILWGLQNSF